jgi:hypothetical protein
MATANLTAAPGEPGPRRQYLSQADEFLRRARLADRRSAVDKATFAAASHVRINPSGLTARGEATLARLEARLGLKGGAHNAA